MDKIWYWNLPSRISLAVVVGMKKPNDRAEPTKVECYYYFFKWLYIIKFYYKAKEKTITGGLREMVLLASLFNCTQTLFTFIIDLWELALKVTHEFTAAYNILQKIIHWAPYSSQCPKPTCVLMGCLALQILKLGGIIRLILPRLTQPEILVFATLVTDIQTEM